MYSQRKSSQTGFKPRHRRAVRHASLPHHVSKTQGGRFNKDIASCQSTLLSATRLLALLLICVTIGCFGAPGHKGPPSPHFDGETFKNLAPFPRKSLRDLLSWRWQRSPTPWEKRDFAVHPKPPSSMPKDEMRVTFVNHATVLVQMAGKNILTDPIYSERPSPISWIGPERAHPPGIAFEDLPSIDIVLISHNHYDHLDIPTLQRLYRDHRPTFVAGLGTSALLAEHNIHNAVDLDWWQHHEIDGLRINAVPTQHWSKRGVWDDYNTLWCGFVVQHQSGSLYFAGDTGFGPHFERTYQRFGPMRLALLPIGAYMPRWFMAPQHISPEEAVDAAIVLRAGVSLGIHYGTFPLADDSPQEAEADLWRYWNAIAPPRPEFWLLEPGEGKNVPSL